MLGAGGVCLLAAPLWAQVTSDKEVANKSTSTTATSPAAVAPPSVPGDADATDSPRERGRVLQKRNPIASEYLALGQLGRSPGAQADGEGNDFRRYFVATGTGLRGRDAAHAGVFFTYQSLSGEATPGFDARLSRHWGAEARRWSLDLKANVTSADRLIEHYEAAWAPEAGGQRYYLQRPRLSQDDIYTRTRSVALTVEHRLSATDTVFAQVSWSDYFDDYFRNRIELNYGQGTVTAAGGVVGNSRSELAVTNAGSRRYFARTKTRRDIGRVHLGGRHDGPVWSVDYGIYYARWDNRPQSDGWNFTERGLDLAYAITDAHLPRFQVTNGVPLDGGTLTTFNDLRSTTTQTLDTDWAARADVQRSVAVHDGTLWLSGGASSRRKERTNGGDKLVYLRDAARPLTMAEVGLTPAPGTIMDGVYALPRGLDTDPAHGRLLAGEPAFAYSASRTVLETLQDVYESTEMVSGVYALGLWKRGAWSVEVGVRGEATRTDSLGTVISPAATDRGTGRLLAQVIDAGVVQNIREVPGAGSYETLLPSAAVEWRITPAVTTRVAAYDQLMRPQYFDIVSYRRVAQPTLTISEGNPALEPTSIRTCAWAVEWRNRGVGVVGAELYATQVSHFFYSAQRFETIDGDIYTTSRVENGGDGTIRGLQLQWTRGYTPVAGLSVSPMAAYTYSESEADLPTRPADRLTLPERSRHLLKVGVEWALASVGGSVDWGYQSKALDDVGPSLDRDGYREAVKSLDAALWWKVARRWKATLSAQNLTDAPERSYEGKPTRVTRNQFSSTTWRLGAEARF